jgi:hypothetical protein
VSDLVLASCSPPARGAPRAVLRDARRWWGVAMDNAVDLPGYKAWLAPDGSRPALHVAFLDLEAAPGERLEGALVAAADLPALDRRERNYRRVDVTDRVAGAPARARVWTYVGLPEARDRLTRARAGGTAVVAEPYLRAVEAAFGPVAVDLPVRRLRRVELP